MRISKIRWAAPALCLSLLFCAVPVFSMGEDYKEIPTADKNADQTLRYLSYAFEARDESAFYEMMDSELSDWFAESGVLTALFSRFKNIKLDIYVDEKSEEGGQVHFRTHWFRSIEGIADKKTHIHEGECTLIFHKTRKAELFKIMGQNPFFYSEEQAGLWR